MKAPAFLFLYCLYTLAYKLSTRSVVRRALEEPHPKLKSQGHEATFLPLRKQSLLWAMTIFFSSRHAAR